MGLFSKWFSKVDNFSKSYEPSDTPYNRVFTGCIPKTLDGKYMATIGKLPDHYGDFLSKSDRMVNVSVNHPRCFLLE